MKDDIINIINLENITRVRSSMNVSNYLPGKKSIVKLIPIQYLEQGVKVLIEGKLFIAFIDSKIPVKEEIIAQVKSVNPFSLSLNLSAEVSKSDDFLIDQIIKKFNLKNNNSVRKTIFNIVQDGHILIKSKIVQLLQLTKLIKSEGIEFSLLVDLIWNYTSENQKNIEELYETLFDESFEEVCDKFYNSVKELMFSQLPQYLIQKIKATLVYNQESNSSKAILNKSEAVLDIIKLFNSDEDGYSISHEINTTQFIKYGTKYILQKSVLKDYDYYPDFIILKREDREFLIHYSIKKVISFNKSARYKIIFKNESLPFELKGIIRDNFLHGNIEVKEEIAQSETISSLEENLFNHWGFRSSISLNSNSKDYHITKINSEVNRLVS
jgi:hypothetical protein